MKKYDEYKIKQKKLIFFFWRSQFMLNDKFLSSLPHNYIFFLISHPDCEQHNN